MLRLTVTKFDSRLTLDNTKDIKVVEVFNSACLLSVNGRYKALLAENRSGLPESMNVKQNNFGNIEAILRNGPLDFDFTCASMWDSEVLPVSPRSISISSNILDSFIRENCTRRSIFIDDLILCGNLAGMIGCGPGLTPAGDDFVIGALNASSFFSLDLFSSIKSVIAGIVSRTTALSNHFLELALTKRAAEDVKHLLFAISRQKRQAISEYAEMLLNFGNTSGLYMLKGIAWVLKRI
ncbi:MAG: DUF2877 domain-containing protein [Elusimicrobiota bacterium]